MYNVQFYVAVRVGRVDQADDYAETARVTADSRRQINNSSWWQTINILWVGGCVWECTSFRDPFGSVLIACVNRTSEKLCKHSHPSTTVCIRMHAEWDKWFFLPPPTFFLGTKKGSSAMTFAPVELDLGLRLVVVGIFLHRNPGF